MSIFDNLSYSNTINTLLSGLRDIYNSAAKNPIKPGEENATTVYNSLGLLIRGIEGNIAEKKEIDYQSVLKNLRQISEIGNKGDGFIFVSVHTITKQLNFLFGQLPSVIEMSERKEKENIEKQKIHEQELQNHKLENNNNNQETFKNMIQEEVKPLREELASLREKHRQELQSTAIVKYEAGREVGKKEGMNEAFAYMREQLSKLRLESSTEQKIRLLLEGGNLQADGQATNNNNNNSSTYGSNQSQKESLKIALGQTKFAALDLLVSLHNKLDQEGRFSANSNWNEVEKRFVRLMIFNLMLYKHTKSIKNIVEDVYQSLISEFGIADQDRFSHATKQCFQNLLTLSANEENMVIATDNDVQNITIAEAEVFVAATNPQNGPVKFLPADNAAFNYFYALTDKLKASNNNPLQSNVNYSAYKKNFNEKVKHYLSKMTSSSKAKVDQANGSETPLVSSTTTATNQP